MLLFLKVRNNKFILVHSKFLLSQEIRYILYRVQKIFEFNSNTAIINQYNYHIMLL